MSCFGLEAYNQNQSEGDVDEESVVLTLVPFTEESTTEYPTESNVSSVIDHKPPARSLVRYEGIKHPTRTIPSTAPPLTLPPINNVSRNELREWCRYLNLSTDGKKVEVYLRLQKHSYAKQECYIPNTSREARLKLGPKKSKIVFRGIGPPSSSKSQKQESGILEIVSSPNVSTLAAWLRIARRASLSMSANRCPLLSNVEAFLPETTGFRWCVVHGRKCPADKKGWIRLQFYAGQTWVPDTPQRMNFLFLLPSCVIPEPGVEDNLLCPECVHSNKKIMRNFKIRSRAKENAIPPNMPP
ncbi:developmental pluripotency-associated protein 2-like [Arvicanthis niloticus]|uniref:developmental pluripotency-associated protein 2-like n=1 Tax=Arvicanthis niloticus TaxID=61156 RepID=UPI0014866523|nr:developmental pluripotency-associated protein 2-like [Arvicanthis niloticus]